MTRTIPEIAAELRLSPRAIRKIVVENGLYIAVSNRKRVTEEQYQALLVILKGAPCQSSHTAGRTASITSGGHTSASALTKALELAAQSTQRSSRQKRKGRYSSGTSKAREPSQPLPKLRLITSQGAAKADT